MKILVIAPYKGLQDLFHEVNKDLKKNMDIELGAWYQGVDLAKSLENKGYDVIISRGATVNLLRESCTIPVVDIKISGYDILRTLMLLKGYEGKIGIMSQLNVIQGADFIGKLLDMDLTFYEDCGNCMERAIEEGVQVIIGDVRSTEVAISRGLNGILITSGKESVVEAIMDAERLVYYMNKEKRMFSGVVSALDLLEEGLLVVNRQEECLVANSRAFELLGVHPDKSPETLLQQTMQYLNLDAVLNRKESRRNERMELSGRTLELSEFPLTDNDQVWGAIAVVKLAKNQTKWEDTPHDKFVMRAEAKAHFNQLVGRSPNMMRLIESAKKISRSNLPIVIYSEPGAGKSDLAQCIHNESQMKSGPFITLDCSPYEPGVMEKEIVGAGNAKGIFELANGGTLYLRHIALLPMRLQQVLYEMISSKKGKRIDSDAEYTINVRIIASNDEKLSQLAARGEFHEKLYRELNAYTLHIPPLRERPDDMDDLVRWFIATSNVAMGKQIVGVKSGGMAMLKSSFSWPGNLIQLKNAVTKMCLLSEGPFIEIQDIEPVIKEIAENRQTLEEEKFSFDNKTLEEIESEIIHRILLEEDFNQTKVAKRLGINRSTLWRKLKVLDQRRIVKNDANNDIVMNELC